MLFMMIDLSILGCQWENDSLTHRHLVA